MAKVNLIGSASKSISLEASFPLHVKRTELAIVLLLFVFVLCCDPFISTSYVPASLRISIEGSVLLLALAINLHYNRWGRCYLWLITITFLFVCFPILGTDTVLKVVSFYNKMVFLILVIGLLFSSIEVLRTFIIIWVVFWRLICYLSIIAFIGYLTHLIPFSYFEFGDINAGSAYTYMHNSVLGNIVTKKMFGVEIGRVAGYIYEPGIIGFFYGFNVLVSRRWIADAKSARKFSFLNFAAGLTTLSMSLIFFLLFFLFYKKMFSGKKFVIALKVSLLTPVIAGIVFYALSSELMVFSSSADRIIRLELAMDIIANNNWLTLLFGNGIGVALEQGGMGISSAIINIFVERGAITLLFIGFMFSKFLSHNKWLLFYLFYYSFMFEMFWYPVFLLGIAIAYVHSQRDVSIKQESSRYIPSSRSFQMDEVVV